MVVSRETEAEIPRYDGHHIAIYIGDFSGPYERLGALGLISADARETRDITHAWVEEARGVDMKLLFDPEHRLEERILAEQFRP